MRAALTTGAAALAAVAFTASPAALPAAWAATTYAPPPMIVYGGPAYYAPYSPGAQGAGARLPVMPTDAGQGRPADGRVLTKPVILGERQMPVGTVLARLVTEGGPGSVWCNLTPRDPGKPGRRPATYDCLADSKGQGVFDQSWTGASPDIFSAPGVSFVRLPKTLSSPVTFREAGAEELPVVVIGPMALKPGQPVTPAAPPPPPPPAAAVQAAASPKALVVSEGATPAALAGTFSKGQPFFSVGVHHGLTGVLTSDVSSKGWFSIPPLLAGQPVYGIPMAGTQGAAIVWCAPRQQGKGRDETWVTVCMPPAETSSLWIGSKPAMMTTNLSWWAGGGRKAATPEVERRPITLPPMTLSYAYGGYDKQGWLTVNVQLDWGEGPQTLRALTIPPNAQGVASMRIMGGEVAIRQIPKVKGADDPTISVEVRSPPRAGDAVVY